MKKKIVKTEYNIESSPFYNKNVKVRVSLEELKTSEEEDIVLARKRYFKQDEYVKFIINEEFNITAYDKISSLAKTILHYIMYDCMEYNSPTFRLKASTIASILSKDESVVFKAIKELIDLKYLAKTRTKEVYWINHNKFYKGNYLTDKYLKQKQ